MKNNKDIGPEHFPFKLLQDPLKNSPDPGAACQTPSGVSLLSSYRYQLTSYNLTINYFSRNSFSYELRGGGSRNGRLATSLRPPGTCAPPNVPPNGRLALGPMWPVAPWKLQDRPKSVPRGPKIDPRGPKIVPRGPKSASRPAKMTIFVRNFDFAKSIEKPNENQRFWLPQAAQNSLKMAPSLAKMAQDRSKMAPRPAKTSPRPPKNTLRSPQDHPRPPQDRPRPLQDRPRLSQDYPKSPQDRPKKPQDRPQRP